MSNNHSDKLLEDVLEAAYRDRVRKLFDVAMENYMGGQREDQIVGRLHAGLQKLYEVHAMLAKEIKNDS